MIGLWRWYAAASGLVMAGLVVAGAALFSSGALEPARLAAAAAVLRNGPAPAPVPAAATPAEAAGREAAESLVRREDELRRLEGRIAARQAQLDAERARFLEEGARLKTEREAFDLRRRDDAQGGIDADLAANVPILSRMDGASIVAALRGWDDVSFVRTLRALKPGKAAEVIDALQNDAAFEQEFRRLPAGAPRGARTRAELLMEEFKKAPRG